MNNHLKTVKEALVYIECNEPALRKLVKHALTALQEYERESGWRPIKELQPSELMKAFYYPAKISRSGAELKEYYKIDKSSDIPREPTYFMLLRQPPKDQSDE